MRAYREGRFFGLLGALAVDSSGKVAAPYDQSSFRFTRIAVREGVGGKPAGVDVSVGGANRAKRPNTQIRFVTDAGVAYVANGAEAYFTFPRDPAGAIACSYVRVEAFAYPSTHLGGHPLTAETLAAMNVHEISRVHDRLEDLSPNGIDPAGQGPISIVDMIFSQPILVRRQEGLWSDEMDLGGGRMNSPWFGLFMNIGNGWIYHNEHAWMFCVGTSANSIWMWTPDLGWLWTAQGVYPTLYSANLTCWLWYQCGSRNPDGFIG